MTVTRRTTEQRPKDNTSTSEPYAQVMRRRRLERDTIAATHRGSEIGSPIPYHEMSDDVSAHAPRVTIVPAQKDDGDDRDHAGARLVAISEHDDSVR